jgi:hypothetical protein
MTRAAAAAVIAVNESLKRIAKVSSRQIIYYTDILRDPM